MSTVTTPDWSEERLSAEAAEAAARFAATAPAEVRYAVLETPAGALVAAATERGLVRLAYEDHNGGTDAILEQLAAKLSPRILEQPKALDPVARELDEFFHGTREHFDLPLDWALTGAFGRRVLTAALAIPYGEVRTYAQVASAAGSPGGSRAAGNALGANPMPIVVPCHRVVRTGGGLGGYTGGLHRKELLLAVERGELTLGV
jgi:methylated-DNA-[protein]-cysteine S-methyltransferase